MTNNAAFIQEHIDTAKAKEREAKLRYIDCILDRFESRGYEIVKLEDRTDKVVISYKIPGLVTCYILKLVINWSAIL